MRHELCETMCHFTVALWLWDCMMMTSLRTASVLSAFKFGSKPDLQSSREPPLQRLPLLEEPPAHTRPHIGVHAEDNYTHTHTHTTLQGNPSAGQQQVPVSQEVQFPAGIVLY